MKDINKDTNKITNGIIISYLHMFIQIGVQLLYVPILIRYVGREEFGIYNFVGNFISYILILNSVFASCVIKFYCEARSNNDENRKIVIVSIARRVFYVIALISFFLVVMLIPVINYVYSASFTNWQLKESGYILIVFGVNVIVSIINSVNFAILMAEQEFVFVKICAIIVNILQPIAVFFAVKYNPYALVIVIVMLAGNLLLFSAYKLFVELRLNIQYNIKFYDKTMARKMLCFSATLLICSLADQLFWRTGQIVVGYYYGVEAIAVMAVGCQIFMAFLPFGTTISSVYYKKVSDLQSKNDINKISELFIDVGRMAFLLCFLILSGFIIFGREFIFLWAGEGFDISYLYAVIVMIPLTLDMIQNLGLVFLQIADKYKFRSHMYLLMSLLNIVVTIIFVRCIGIIGAAIATASSMFVCNVIIMNFYYKIIGINIKLFWKKIFTNFIPLCLYGVLFYFLLNSYGISDNWNVLIVNIAIYSIFYILCVFVFCLSKGERQKIIKKVKTMYFSI